MPCGSELITELFDEVSDGICLSSLEGRILYINPAAAALLGLKDQKDASSLCEVLCARLSGPAARGRGLCPLRESSTSHHAATFSGVYDPPGGSGPKSLRIRCADVPTALLDSWEPRKVFTTIEDVSAEQELELHKEEWRNMIVHDLRSPLTSVYGTLKLLHGSPPGPDETGALGRLISAAVASCERVLKLLQLYLEVAKLEQSAMPISPSALDLARIAAECALEVRPVAQSRGVAVDLLIAPNLPVFADAELLTRVLENLLTNALKFSPRGSRVQLAAKRVTQDVTELSCRDGGPGIPADDLPRIFDRFYQARQKRTAGPRGVGLGLAFCRSAVQSMGGSIEVFSRVGSGTEFFVRLPAGPPNAVSGAGSPGAGS